MMLNFAQCEASLATLRTSSILEFLRRVQRQHDAANLLQAEVGQLLDSLSEVGTGGHGGGSGLAPRMLVIRNEF